MCKIWYEGFCKSYFEAEDLRFNEGERFAIDFHEAFARLDEGLLVPSPRGGLNAPRIPTLQCATAVAVSC